MSRQPPRDGARLTDADLNRVRDAERRRAVAQAQLAERESQLAALQERVRSAEQRSLDTVADLRAQLRDSQARRAAAERACESAVARSVQAQSELAEAQEGHRAREAALRQAAGEIEARVAAAEQERDAALAQVAGDRARLLAQIAGLEQLVSTLSLALASTRDDVDRAERSRAWRIGHGMSRAAARVALRPDKTAGALASALRRIEEVQQATRALPAAQSPLPVVIAPTLVHDEPVELAASDLAE